MKTYTLQDLQDLLPSFIDIEYPKGKNKDRGLATVAIALYTTWLRERELKALTDKMYAESMDSIT